MAEVTIGRKYIVRIHEMPAIAWFRASASPSARGIPSGTDTTV